MRGVFVHIGTNIGLGCPCPIFADGKFRYIPIPEDFPSSESWTYEHLGLTKYVPRDWYYDPELLTFTWGDYINRRTYLVRQLSGGDFVFFIATLQLRGIREHVLPWIDLNWAYYIIGYFELETPVPYLKNVKYPIPYEIKTKFANNAHVRREFKKNLKPFCIFKGSERSKNLPVPVPFSHENEPNELANAVLQGSNAMRPRWWSYHIIEENDVQRIFQEIHTMSEC